MQIRIMVISSRLPEFPALRENCCHADQSHVDRARPTASPRLAFREGGPKYAYNAKVIAALPWRGHEFCLPRGGGADMNKWVIAAILVAVAVFMYVSIIYKMA